MNNGGALNLHTFHGGFNRRAVFNITLPATSSAPSKPSVRLAQHQIQRWGREEQRRLGRRKTGVWFGRPKPHPTRWSPKVSELQADRLSTGLLSKGPFPGLFNHRSFVKACLPFWRARPRSCCEIPGVLPLLGGLNSQHQFFQRGQNSPPPPSPPPQARHPQAERPPAT